MYSGLIQNVAQSFMGTNPMLIAGFASLNPQSRAYGGNRHAVIDRYAVIATRFRSLFDLPFMFPMLQVGCSSVAMCARVQPWARSSMNLSMVCLVSMGV